MVPLHDRAGAPRPGARRRARRDAAARRHLRGRRKGGEKEMNDPNCIFCKIVRGEFRRRKSTTTTKCWLSTSGRRRRCTSSSPKAHIASCTTPPRRINRRSARCSPSPAASRRRARATAFAHHGQVGHQEVYHVHMHVLGGPIPSGRCCSAVFGRENRREYGSFSIWHWLIVLVIVMLIFGTRSCATSARPWRRGARIQGWNARRRREARRGRTAGHGKTSTEK